MLTAIYVMIGLAVVLGILLGYSALKFKVDGDPLVARIDAILPQTQCGQCRYEGCKPYAEAMALGLADINQCPPGGTEGVERLAAITGKPVTALNPENGLEGPRTIAIIDEAWCIGCTLCIKACPTDAILGANKLMHTVIEPWCTGCELCIPVCPVDCIALESVTDEKTGVSTYPATLTLERRHMQVDGKAVAISPGMNVTAEIKTGQRRIIEFLLSPIVKAGKESLRER